jgi:16S rRNA (uracil1498-N3)-methyltransferase
MRKTMRTTRIHTPQRLVNDAIFALEPASSHHLARVLRLGVGDALILFDGRGGEYPSEISAIEKKQVLVRTGTQQLIETESSLAIHLGIAVSRGERMDWIVQKSTELGVASVAPLITERTGVKLSGERAAKKIEHWQQIAISACEQCGRNRPPAVHAQQTLDKWLATTEADEKFVLHHRAAAAGATTSPASIALLIGPEGGLSDAEINAAQNAGFTALQLGPRVLRTETAPLAAIAIMQSYWGDMALN